VYDPAVEVNSKSAMTTTAIAADRPLSNVECEQLLQHEKKATLCEMCKYPKYLLFGIVLHV
jgi:hypothetical protein